MPTLTTASAVMVDMAVLLVGEWELAAHPNSAVLRLSFYEAHIFPLR
jgi:hypothetical protein